jgi:hypothetical protein
MKGRMALSRSEISRRSRQRARAGIVGLYRSALWSEHLWALADQSEGRLTDAHLADPAAIERELTAFVHKHLRNTR